MTSGQGGPTAQDDSDDDSEVDLEDLMEKVALFRQQLEHAPPEPRSVWMQPSFSGHWARTERFLARAFRVKRGQSGKARHFSGGPATHRGAKCKKCSRELGLLWDIDLSDPALDDVVRSHLGPVSRLPLYFCWQCMAVSYRVKTDRTITVYAGDRSLDTLERFESPFPELPAVGPRRPLKLERISSLDDAILLLADLLKIEALDEESTSRLTTFFGECPRWASDFQFSQLGGRVKLQQGHSELYCPNPECVGSVREKIPLFIRMKDLAVVTGDCEVALKEPCLAVHFSICCLCFSIRAQYEST